MATNETGDKKTARVQVSTLIVGYIIVGLPWLAMYLRSEWLGRLIMPAPPLELSVWNNIYFCLVLFAPYLICSLVLLTTKGVRIIVPAVILIGFAVVTQCLLAISIVARYAG